MPMTFFVKCLQLTQPKSSSHAVSCIPKRQKIRDTCTRLQSLIENKIIKTVGYIGLMFVIHKNFPHLKEGSVTQR